MVIVKKVNSQVSETEKSEIQTLKEDLSALTDKVSKMAGSYDGGYGAPKESKPNGPAADAVPGVPGTSKSETPPDAPEKKDCYGDGYVEPSTPNEPKAQDKDKDSDDGEECTCDKCGSTYKSKRVAAKQDDEDDDEDKDEEKAVKSASALDFGKVMKVCKPSKEDLIRAKTMESGKNKIFGVAKANNSLGRKMTEWAEQETVRLTPTKQ